MQIGESLENLIQQDGKHNINTWVCYEYIYSHFTCRDPCVHECTNLTYFHTFTVCAHHVRICTCAKYSTHHTNI